MLGHGSGGGCQPGCASSTLPDPPRMQGSPARVPPAVAPQPSDAPSDPADGELYSGTSSDFMGSSAAFFRTWVHGAEQSYIRTEQNQDHWLHGRSGGTRGARGGGVSCLLGRGWGQHWVQSSVVWPPSPLWGEALMKPLVGPTLQHSLCSLSARNGALPSG